MSDPFRQMNRGERAVKNAVNAPGRQARQLKGRARSLGRQPGNQLRRMKSDALRPVRGVQRQAQYAQSKMNYYSGMGSQQRQYKRKPDRLANTDMTVSAMLYPFGMGLAWIAGFMSDWDTAYIRYHLAHARILAFIAFWFIPLSIVCVLINPLIALAPMIMLFLFWAYMWYLGFQAYGGQIVVVPLVTTYLERRNKLDFETLERIYQQ